MGSKNNATVSPAEALSRFPPMGKHKNAHISPPIRRGKAIWRVDQDCWLVEERPTMVAAGGAHSTSAYTVPTAAHPAKRLRVQQVLLRERAQPRRITVSAKSQSQLPELYSPVQIASFRHYKEKSKRLSSHEYGNIASGVQAEHVQSQSLDNSRFRVVDLESDDSIAPTQESKPRDDRLQRPRPPQYGTWSYTSSPSASSSLTQAATIVRKPVGSAPRIPKAGSRSTSDSIMSWQLPQKAKHPISPPPSEVEYEGHEEVRSSPSCSPVESFGSPWDNLTLPPSPSPPQRTTLKTRGRHNRLIRNEHFIRNVSVSRDGPLSRHAEPTSLTTSSSSTQSSRGPVQVSNDEAKPGHNKSDQQDTAALDVSSFLTATTESWRKFKGRIMWTGKALLLLYLATCVWGILSAIKDAVVTALAPVFACWAFLSWVLGI